MLLTKKQRKKSPEKNNPSRPPTGSGVMKSAQLTDFKDGL